MQSLKKIHAWAQMQVPLKHVKDRQKNSIFCSLIFQRNRLGLS